MKGAQALYRALLRCYPASFRQEYGQQMLLTFAEQLGDVRQRGGRAGHLALWAQVVSDVLTIAPGEHWHVIRQDLRYAFRSMAASPGFTALAVLSLALGIGANTAIFSLWNGVLRAPLPGVRAPGELVMLTDPDRSGSWTGGWRTATDGPRSWLTYEEFEQIRDRAGSFSGVMASTSSLLTWQARIDGGPPEDVNGRLVSGGFFHVLGVRPAIGRLFEPADDRGETTGVVVSHHFWQRRFAGSPDVLGRTIVVRGVPVTVAGVAAAEFIGETSGQLPDVWLPLRLQPRVIPDRDRLHDTPPDKSMWLNVFGRLKPGATIVRAEAEANGIFQAGLVTFYGAGASEDRRRGLLDQRIRVQPGGRGASPARADFGQSLTALLTAVGVLLLIACANLANLLLARGTARTHEIALRVSLGASRSRIIRQLLTESLALAALGGVAAVIVAYGLHGALVAMMAEADTRFHLAFALNARIVLFTAGATIAAALLFGAFPAWHLTRDDMGARLKEQSRGALGRSRGMRSGRWLVSVQLALSLPLLVGAGLLARTVYNLQRADLGFPAQRLLLVRVDLREAAPTLARRDEMLRQLVGALRREPRVDAVSFSQLGVFTGGASSRSIEVEGYRVRSERDRASAVDVVGPGYFSTLSVPLRLGREILESDRASTPRVCVINDAFAARYFEGRNPIGLRVSTTEEPRLTYLVVGVAPNVRTQDLRETVEPRFFVSAAQPPVNANSPTFLIRTAAGGASMDRARAAIGRVDPALPILSATTIEEQIAPLTAQDRATARLAVVFGSVALALAAIGLYGVLSYGVARRTPEIAVRMALGAQRRRVIGMILRETSGVVAMGLILGGALAYGASRLIGSRLYGVEPQDPLTVTAATALLLSVALSAAYLPARRASRLDPMVALRQ
ncbi:MAG TPA: ABC transporter permease [Vicinamibacterales bacterium]|nr:ABC transporter permease [Vicinamibacterales bacterium]